MADLFEMIMGEYMSRSRGCQLYFGIEVATS